METVKIGNRYWTLKNLSIDKFRNNEIIPEAKTAEEWIEMGFSKKAAWCYLNNDPNNGNKYGKLYNCLQ